jgi:hypothetical protein
MSEFHGRIQKQSQLPLPRVFNIAWKNIRVRLFRSLLVTSGIILALAFLTYILCADALQQQVEEKGSPQLIQRLRRQGLIEPEAPRTAEAREVDESYQGEFVEPEDLAPPAPVDRRGQIWWLVGLALMVSFVGILNAMLLSVTERYAEIGTMKCLGALDFLIVELFLLESALQGMVGAGIGMAIGLSLSVIEGWTRYGAEMWGVLPVLELVKLLGICLLAGVVLTIAGALYPAWRAARMQPVEAMRSEV